MPATGVPASRRPIPQAVTAGSAHGYLRGMAELDYAFLADYARVESNGTLTAVGASWTHLRPARLPGSHHFYVAGRIRTRLQEPPTDLRIALIGPLEAYRLETSLPLQADPNATPYGEGWLGHVFAFEVGAPLTAAGMYVVELSIEGETVRRLKFEVVEAQSR